MRTVDRSRSRIPRRAGWCLAGWLCLLPVSYAGRHAAVYGPVTVDTTIGGTLQFAVAAASVNENAGCVVLSVTRMGGSVGAARVAYATADGTARAGTNYTAASGTLSWAEGDSDPRPITVPVVNWSALQGPLTFTMTLSNAVWATLGSPASVVITIEDVVPGAPKRLYVSPDGIDVPPYANWKHAATSIQAAVDAAGDGDEVVVADGVYPLPAQVTVAKGITLRSDGGRARCRMDGGFACRCLWLAHSNAVVSGFTITRGWADQEGAGIYINQAGTVRECNITNNTCSNALYYTPRGGGIYLSGGGTIQHCLVSGNILNGTGGEGGGIYMSGGLVENCLVIGNMSPNGLNGSGIHLDKGIVNHCTILNNCGAYRGGGVTLQGDNARVVNSVVHSNRATAYPDCRIYLGSVVFTCCSGYGMPDDAGNVYADPLFVDYTNSDFHLQPGSPCIDAGATTDVVTVDYDYTARPLDGDLDGIPRVDMGAFEFTSPILRCGLTVDKHQGFDPLPVRIECFPGGLGLDGLYYWWDFDNDGHPDLAGSNSVVTTLYTNWGWKSVSVTVSNAAGETASATLTNTIKVGRPLVYIAPSASGTLPYASWPTAASNLNMITDLLVDGTEVVVTNGRYVLSQEFLLDWAVTLRSVNGWRQTILDGNEMTRCVRLTHAGAVVDGFTLTRGYGVSSGGGAYIVGGGVVRNCWINNNRAYSGAISGGGGVAIFESGLLANCLVTSNTTASGSVNEGLARGGGVWLRGGGHVEYCTITHNSLPVGKGGGGVYGEDIVAGGGTIYNCIVWGNSSPTSPNIGRKNHTTGVGFTCTDPISSLGGNITNPPLLGPGEKLLPGSPCIDAGTNHPDIQVDMDGIPRGLDGNNDGLEAPDMGAFEFVQAGDYPIITEQPRSHTLTLGYPAIFSITAAGKAPLYYQWQKDLVSLVAATGATYRIAAVAAADAGLYRCRVSNALGIVTSQAAVLTVIEPPRITRQPHSVTATVSDPVAFLVTASGTRPLFYEWQKDRTPIDGAVAARYDIRSVQMRDAGAYRCLVSNAAGQTVSATAVLTVGQPAPPVQGIINGDFNGDGTADPALYDPRTGTWTVRLSSAGYAPISMTALLGGPDWMPAAADYDGDRLCDPAVYRERDGSWKALLSGRGYALLQRTAFLGGPGWAPASADYEGDRHADYTVYQEAAGDWAVKLSSAGYLAVPLRGFLGGPGYCTASADYDGDGLADPAVYRRSDGTWKVLLSGSNYAPLTLQRFLGGPGWDPVPGDYDADGLADPAVRKSDGSVWRIMLSGSGYAAIDVPLGM